MAVGPFGPNDDFLLPPSVFAAKRKKLMSWGLRFPTALKPGATSVLRPSSSGFEKWPHSPLLANFLRH